MEEFPDGGEEFFGLVSNTGGGYCFYRDARMRRLTRYRYNNVPTDAGGRVFWLEGALWLEAYLAKYPYTVLIISHDRGLLNRAVGQILHPSPANPKANTGWQPIIEKELEALGVPLP